MFHAYEAISYIWETGSLYKSPDTNLGTTTVAF